MRWRDLTLWSVADVECGKVPTEEQEALSTIVSWSRAFLVPSHPDLGRSGPVCPFTKPSIDKSLFFLACPQTGGAIGEIAATVLGYCDWHSEMAAGLSEKDKQLLTFLILFPQFDHTDSAELDKLQAHLKDDFVTKGLMVGQFHPVCDQPGLWNEDFRPLRAPIPLLAIRYMVPFDLPFLVGSPLHLNAYLARFAPDIPTRVRGQLTQLVTK